MKSYSHPNVLPLHASFVAGHELWMVTPFMSGGSVLHIMKYGHPEVSTGARAGPACVCVCVCVCARARVLCVNVCLRERMCAVYPHARTSTRFSATHAARTVKRA